MRTVGFLDNIIGIVYAYFLTSLKINVWFNSWFHGYSVRIPMINKSLCIQHITDFLQKQSNLFEFCRYSWRLHLTCVVMYAFIIYLFTIENYVIKSSHLKESKFFFLYFCYSYLLFLNRCWFSNESY